MNYPDLNINLSDQQRAMPDMAMRFGSEVMRPIGIELDKMADPADVIADESPLWDVFKQFRELGLHKRGLPKAVGGMLEDIDGLSGILMAEQFGYWDHRDPTRFSISERWKKYGTPEFKTVRIPRGLPRGSGFQKGNKYGRKK